MSQQIQIEKGIPLPTKPKGSCANCWRIPREGLKTCDVHLAVLHAAFEDQKSKGLCGYGRCPKAAATGHTMCRPHLDRIKNGNKKLYAKRTRRGLCRQCGKFRMPGDATWCVMCRAAKGFDPLPTSLRREIRKFWRQDRIAERRALVSQSVQLLRDERLREIVNLRQGLVDGVDHSLESVGRKFGVTRERIRQIEEKAYGLLEALGVSTTELKGGDRQRAPIQKQARNPAEVKKECARRMVRDAVAAGQIVKKSCERCGTTKNVQAHHHDYDKPLDVEWVCSPHHAEAHGKTIRNEKKKHYLFPAWLERVQHCHGDLYDAPHILELLKRRQLPQGVVMEATGLTHQVLVKIVRGQDVETDHLLTMLRYVESLKAEKAA